MTAISREIIVGPGSLAPQRLESRAGNMVTNKLENLVVSAAALKALAEAASRAPRAITAITTIGAGASYSIAGNLIVGVPLSIIGLAELVTTATQGPSVNIRNILQDSRASLDMVKLLSQANQESYLVVDSNLVQIEKQVGQLNKRMEEIRSIATQENREIEEQKNKATALFTKANELFAAAEKEFAQTRLLMDKAQKKFVNVSSYIDSLLDIVKSDRGDLPGRLAKCERMAIITKNTCNDGVDAQNEAMASLTKALDLLNLAQEKQTQAFEEAGKAQQMSTDALTMIAAKAEADQRTAVLVQQTRVEMDVMNQRGKDMDNLVEDLHTNMNVLEENAPNPLTWMMGGAVLSGAAAVALHPIAGPALVVGGIAAANGSTLLGLKPSADFSVKPLQTPAKAGEKLVSCQFAKKSTGLWGRFQNRQSWTVGTVSIKAGDEEIIMPFDANAKGSKIAPRHMLELLKTLRNKVKYGEITAETCLSIIRELEIINIDRSGGGKDNLVGLIPVRSPYFNELVRQCQTIIANRKI